MALIPGHEPLTEREMAYGNAVADRIQARIDAGLPSADLEGARVRTPEDIELAHLRAENEALKAERDDLQKQWEELHLEWALTSGALCDAGYWVDDLHVGVKWLAAERDALKAAARTLIDTCNPPTSFDQAMAIQALAALVAT